MSFYVALLLLTILLSTGNCEHENHHHHHSDDDHWPTLISQIEFLWKSTPPSLTAKELTESHDKGHHWSSPEGGDLTTEASSTTFLIQNGTFIDGVRDTFRASLALLVGVPIFGVLFLCCLCYCCCKCCCVDEEKGQIIVMQQNNAPAAPSQPPPPHIIVQQQPVYQTPYVMQPPPQWSPHQNPQQFPTANAAYDNPNYGAPSAPPQYAHKY